MVSRAGVVIDPYELNDDWVRRIMDGNICLVGLHPDPKNSTPERILAWLRDAETSRLLGVLTSNGIQIEWEVHALSWLLPRKLFRTSPHWFRMNEAGERTSDHNLCCSSEEALETIRANAAMYAALLIPTTHRYHFWLDDVSNCRCHCPRCRSLSAADQALKVYNAIAQGVRRTDPEATQCYENMKQSLEMDYILVHSADQQIPSAQASFWAKLKHFFVTFFLSFVKDYSMVGTTAGEGETITVWTTSGRDQASILMDMITESFTAETGIQVNVSLVQTGFIEATLAGTGPDVAIGVSRGQPVNLACRGALVDLSQFEGFQEVASRFSETAMVPYEYEGGTYAIPNTQGYYMMFYRKDILEKLGLEIPQTWDELLKMVPRLQKNHMEIGLPYSVISAAIAVNNGMGAKDIFPILLLQNGGDLYNEDATASALNSEAGMAAFHQWCEYYTQYGFELVYDFYTRFRNGDMPIGISDLSMYNTLVAGAPELRGEWGIVPIPGTVQEDGTIDRSTGSIGSATVMFKTKANENAAHREACWKFMEWWMRTETQDTYNEQVENVMGPAGRNATANLESFSHLPWSEEEKQALDLQREHVKDLREVPGSYFVSRCIDNAFRAVIYDGDNAREVFEQEVESINREIARKREELGLD